MVTEKISDNTRQVIGQNLRVLRSKADKSQQELGNFLGITFQQIQKYEKGTNRISAEDLYSLAGFLEVNINDFFASLNSFEEVIQDKEFLKIVRQLRNIKNRTVRNKIINLILALESESESAERDLENEKILHYNYNNKFLKC